MSIVTPRGRASSAARTISKTEQPVVDSWISKCPIKIKVGPHDYELHLVHGYIHWNDTEAVALCDSELQRILISDVMPMRRRMANFWHELAHAWLRELNIHQTDSIQDEPLAELVSLGMSSMTLEDFQLIFAYLNS